MMKRPAILAAVIGIAVAALVSAAHALGLLAPAETPLLDWMQRAEVPPRVLGNVWQYLFVVPVSLAVAWLTLSTSRRHRVGWLLLAFVAEMLVLVWVGSLYHLFFQPIPTVVAAVVAYALAIGYLAWESRPHLPKSVPLTAPAPVTALASAPGVPAIAPVIASAPKPVLTTPMLLPRRDIPKKEAVPKSPEPKQPEPMPRGPEQAVPNMAPQPERPRPEQTFAGAPDVFEASVLVCDLAEKYDLADNSEPAAAARALAKFCQRAADLLLKAGGHLHKADGEGVVALFGFPQTSPGHAEQAVRAAFELNRAFSSEAHSSNGDNVAGGGAHIGVSSGPIVAGHSEGKHDLFVLGEAVELARRFCLANRFYGSRILVGPQTFELASSTVVARPIDFLTGVTAQERHEIYEPLALAADAPAELLARRDSFWNGVVLYREKRWAEALSEFQKARSDADEDDPPLNLYLRRLEPLALHFMESGRE